MRRYPPYCVKRFVHFCLGGVHSASGVTTICLTHCNTCPSHRVDQVVDYGLWNVGPLLFNGCVKLLDIARNWNTLSYTPIQSIPHMLNGWHVRGVCWPCKNWDVLASRNCVQILATWGRALSCCNMRWWSWMNGTGWLVSDDLGGEGAGCGGPGLVWLHVVCGCEAGWMYCQILWNAFDREINIKFTGNSSSGNSCSQHANCTLPQNLRHLWHCAVW